MTTLHFDGLQPRQVDDIADDGTPIFHEQPKLEQRLDAQIARLRLTTDTFKNDNRGVEENPAQDSMEVESTQQDATPNQVTGDTDMKDASIRSQDEEDLTTSAPEYDGDGDDDADAEKERVALATFRREIADAVYHAEAEVLVLLDLFNVVLGEANQAPLPLPPKTLGGTRTARVTRSAEERQAEAALQFGIRQKQLSTTADILRQGMKHLSSVAQEERHFWRSALALQHDLWPMATGPGTGATRPLQVNYGYYDAGSLSQEFSVAELVRTQKTVGTAGLSREKASQPELDLILPHNTAFVISVEIWERDMGQHRLIGKSCTQHSKDLGRVPVAVEQQVDTKGIDRARKRLARARATLFDSELFQEIVREARAGGQGEAIMEDCVTVAINDRLQINIRWQECSDNEDGEIVHEHMDDGEKRAADTMAEMLKTILRLLLRRRHHVNIERKRAASGPAKRSRALPPDPSMRLLHNAIRPFRRIEHERAIRNILDRVTYAFTQAGVSVLVRFEHPPPDDINSSDEARWLIVQLARRGPTIRFAFRGLHSFELHRRGAVISYSDLAQFPLVLMEELALGCLDHVAHIMDISGLEEVKVQYDRGLVKAVAELAPSSKVREKIRQSAETKEESMNKGPLKCAVQVELEYPQYLKDHSMRAAFCIRTEYSTEPVGRIVIQTAAVGSANPPPLQSVYPFDIRVHMLLSAALD